MKIEQKVADTILQNSLGSVVVDGKEYQIEPPTTGTLIMVSSLIPELPQVTSEIESEDFIPQLLESAKDCNAIGLIVATLILGAKKIKEQPFTTITGLEYKKKWSWRKLRKIEVPIPKLVPVYERDYLAEKILDSMTAEELRELIKLILSEGCLADFFLLTTFLRTKNILTPTREVVETTAFGDLSEAGQNIGN